MLTQLTVKKFVDYIDKKILAENCMRDNLCAFHLFSFSDDNKRLAVTNGHILVIFDISTDLLGYAVNTGILFEKSNVIDCCYTTQRYADRNSDMFFPVPEIKSVIPPFVMAEKSDGKWFNPQLLIVADRIFDVFDSGRRGWLPFLHSEDFRGGSACIDMGIFIMIMPIRVLYDRFDLNLETCLPGFTNRREDLC